MSGINETSVNAYMAISGAESEKRRKPRRKKKRAVSQAAGNSSLQGVESKQNLLTMEDEIDDQNRSNFMKQSPDNMMENTVNKTADHIDQSA